MMDDKKVPMSDDEFHFTDAEETKDSDFTVAPDFAEKKPGKINRRNVLIAVGIIIVALSLYKLIGMFFVTEGKKPTTVATTTTSQPQIQFQPQPVSAVNTGPDITNQLSQMKETDVATTQQMSAISEQLSSLNTTTENLSDAIASINQQMAILTAQIQTTQSAVNALKPKPRPQVKFIKVKVLPPPPPQWYIQAMVPGRAWLVQANGQTTTVSQGTLLYGYGKVTYISVVNGIVRTSSGAIIRFNNT